MIEINQDLEAIFEDFITTKSLKDHFDKHKREFDTPFKNAEEYEEYANLLAKTDRSKVGSSKSSNQIIGYVMNYSGFDRYVYFHRDLHWCVIFDPCEKNENPVIRSFFNEPFFQYVTRKNRYFSKELPWNE